MVIGMKSRRTNDVQVKAIASADMPSLQCFVCESTEPGAMVVYPDEASAYAGMASAYGHEAGIDGAESFWSMLKWNREGTPLKISLKHLDRHVGKFAEWFTACKADTLKQVAGIKAGTAGKWYRNDDPIADNRLNSGARS